MLTHPTVRAATRLRMLQHLVRLSATVKPVSRVSCAPEKTPHWHSGDAHQVKPFLSDTTKLPPLVNQPAVLGGQLVVRISRARVNPVLHPPARPPQLMPENQVSSREGVGLSQEFPYHQWLALVPLNVRWMISHSACGPTATITWMSTTAGRKLP